MEISGIISALIIGLIIGALGSLLLPGRQRVPIWLTIIIGIIAAFIGTAIAAAFGVADTKGVDWIEWLFQIALAAIGVALADRFYSGPGGGSTTYVRGHTRRTPRRTRRTRTWGRRRTRSRR